MDWLFKHEKNTFVGCQTHRNGRDISVLTERAQHANAPVNRRPKLGLTTCYAELCNKIGLPFGLV